MPKDDFYRLCELVDKEFRINPELKLCETSATNGHGFLVIFKMLEKLDKRMKKIEKICLRKRGPASA